MKILLDTNVVLTGSFNPKGPAGKLNSLVGTARFLFSQHVLDECKKVLRRAGASNYELHDLMQEIAIYFESLRAEEVDEHKPPPGISANDPSDDIILGTAIAAEADSICTYNLKHFPNEPITPCTPLAVLRKFGRPELDQYIQKIELSSHGTLLFFGSIHHPSSMGPIIRSANGTLVNCDKEGKIELLGPAVKRSKSLRPLESEKEFRLTIRYNMDALEAETWEKVNDGWEKQSITLGAAEFADETNPVLFFIDDHKFSGHIQSVSGVPRWVKDKSLHNALDNYSLEAISGSLGARAIVKDFVLPRRHTRITRAFSTLRGWWSSVLDFLTRVGRNQR